MILKCKQGDVNAIFDIINDAATAYRGVIPADCWHDPYMSMEELQREIGNRVEFWAYEQGTELVGVMGFQDKGDVALIRHAYVRTTTRNKGFGTALLRHLEQITTKPILIGTWADASWAIRFYQKNGYQLLSRPETERLLRRYWKVPNRQIQTSVVLANKMWISMPTEA